MNLPILEMINIIDEPNRAACLRLYKDNIDLMKKIPGSSHNHQAWVGGYNDHIAEVMNIAIMLYPIYSIRPLNFTISDALLVMYVHDLEKLWRTGAHYVKSTERALRFAKLKEYGFSFTEQQVNALEYVEGERDDYSNKKRVMNELAAFCHICDVSSARIWHDYPKRMFAEIYWYTVEEGGRPVPIIPNPNRGLSYWANTWAKDTTSWSIGVYFNTQEPVQMGTTGKYEVKFVEKGYEHFNSGDALYICEGPRVVGKGTIL